MTIQYINVNQLSAKLAGRSIRSIQRDIKSGQLPKPYRVNGRLLFIEAEVDAHIAGQSDQSNISISEQDSTMTTIEQNLSEARQAMKTVGDNHRAMQNTLNGLKSKLFSAADHNSTEIEARADALADGIERDNIELIDVKALQEEIQVNDLTLRKLTERVNDAKGAVKEAGEIILQHQKRDARQLLRDRFGFDATRNKFRMDKLAELDGNGIMDLHTVARLAWGNISLSDLFAKVIPATDAVRAASKQRVDALL